MACPCLCQSSPQSLDDLILACANSDKLNLADVTAVVTISSRGANVANVRRQSSLYKYVWVNRRDVTSLRIFASELES